MWAESDFFQAVWTIRFRFSHSTWAYFVCGYKSDMYATPHQHMSHPNVIKSQIFPPCEWEGDWSRDYWQSSVNLSHSCCPNIWLELNPTWKTKHKEDICGDSRKFSHADASFIMHGNDVTSPLADVAMKWRDWGASPQIPKTFVPPPASLFCRYTRTMFTFVHTAKIQRNKRSSAEHSVNQWQQGSCK